MDTFIKAKSASDLLDYLAEERRFRAWNCAGIILTEFGFVMARFEILLEPLRVPQQLSAAQPHKFSPWFGAALIAISALVNLVSVQRSMRLAGEVNWNHFADRSLCKHGVFVALSWRWLALP